MNYNCDSRDIALSENHYLSFDRRKTHRNSNVFAYVSVKNDIHRAFIEPNILQAKSSFVVPDHSNELSKKYKDILKKNGFTVKVIDFEACEQDVSPEEYYNPFCYIQELSDAFYLVETFVEKTGAMDTANTETWFTDSEKNLLAALVLSFWMHHPKKEQTFYNILELLKTTDGKNGVNLSSLDKYFDKIREKETDSEAVAIYERFKEKAGINAKRIIISVAVRLQAFVLKNVKTITSKDSLHLENLYKKKTAIFVNLPVQENTVSFLASILYQQILSISSVGNEKIKHKEHCIIYVNQDVLADSFHHLLNVADTYYCSIIFYTNYIEYGQLSKVFSTMAIQSDTFMCYGCESAFDAKYISKKFNIPTENILKMSDDVCMGQIRGYKPFKDIKQNIEEL